MLRFIVVIVFVFFCSEVSAQSKEHLRQKVAKNKEVFLTNLDKSFSELDTLLKEAEDLQDSTSILTILDRKCRYFYSKEDVNSLITASEKLKVKASLFQNYNSQAMSHVYLAEAYSINRLFDKAVPELDKALALIEKTDLKSLKDFLTKTNILISQANVFNDKGNPREAARRQLIAIEGYQKIKDPERVKLFQFINYSNIASMYVQFDVDSAEIYVRKSMALESADLQENNIVVSRNYFILGKINYKRKNNPTALHYFLKSNSLKNKSKETQDLKDLYKSISIIYNELGKTDSALIYQNKLKEIELKSLENKYQSLQKVLNKKAEPEDKGSTIPLLLVGLISIVLIAIALFWYFTKTRKKAPQANLVETYDSLIQLAGKNDPAYLPAFEKAFPDFSEKLLQHNPDLSISEIEFCSLLKLNLSTKKIAQLKFIEPRTVQNKKHRIRKRLDIPTSMDLYNWFNKL